MATFIIEDGTGLEDANTYAGVQFSDQYHNARGHDRWNDATNDQKQKALVRATDHVERLYGRRFLGVKATQEQALSWPRVGAVDASFQEIDSESIPVALQKAIAEYALRAYELGELTPDPPRPVAPQKFLAGTTSQTNEPVATGIIMSQNVEVGPIKEETSFSAPTVLPSGASYIPSYPAADAYIKELLGSSGVVRW